MRLGILTFVSVRISTKGAGFGISLKEKWRAVLSGKASSISDGKSNVSAGSVPSIEFAGSFKAVTPSSFELSPLHSTPYQLQIGSKEFHPSFLVQPSPFVCLNMSIRMLRSENSSHCTCPKNGFARTLSQR